LFRSSESPVDPSASVLLLRLLEPSSVAGPVVASELVLPVTSEVASLVEPTTPCVLSPRLESPLDVDPPSGSGRVSLEPISPETELSCSSAPAGSAAGEQEATPRTSSPRGKRSSIRNFMANGHPRGSPRRFASRLLRRGTPTVGKRATPLARPDHPRS